VKQISKYDIPEDLQTRLRPIIIDADISKTMQLLSLLSKPDALKIFMTAKDGIESTTNTPSQMGLTKKQYYIRLKQLVLSGLLTKQDTVYTHTVFGSVIYQNYLTKLVEEVRNSKFLEMVEMLKQSPKFSKKDVEDVSFKARASWAHPSKPDMK